MKNDMGYYLGLDIGTDSVGYAVTDERYKLIKFKGEPMWGSHLFDSAKQCSERRGFRTARRRLDRRQQRVALVDEIFAPEVVKVDPNFYIRKKESALYGDDLSIVNQRMLYFNDEGYSDKEFHTDYPTIHHLICALMKDSDTIFDIRLINIAIDWLVAHRGHFLSDVGTDSVDKVLDFGEIYRAFTEYFEINEIESPWDKIESDDLGCILKLRGVNDKKIKLKELLYGNRIPEGNYYFDRKEMIAFLAGGKVKVAKLFPGAEFEEEISMSISDDMEILIPQLGEYADFISLVVKMYDWSVLSDILEGSKYISESKVKQYEQHKSDLRLLKAFVKKYRPEKYDLVFKKVDKDANNYAAYSYNIKSAKESNLPKGKASREDFYAFLKKNLSLDSIECDCEEDKIFLADILERINSGTFMPKQVNTDNRVIPYQLYYKELEMILENAEKHYSFLSDIDDDGYSNIEKIKSIFKFKIPYYVGPLRTDNSRFAWMKRKAEGKIYPWNFNDKVDLDESENEFINRMTNTCTYLPGEDVLPKWSLLYTKYNVLNEINSLKQNDKDISVEAKQGIYNDLFCKNAKVSPKRIKEYLISRGYIEKEDRISGIDETIKSSLKSRWDFRNLLSKGTLSEDDVERIITRSTYAEDKQRFKGWLKREFPTLGIDDQRYISKLKYSDFGRLSEKLLVGIEGADNRTGEIGTIMHFLWTTNDNLMQIIESDNYTFKEIISKIRIEYYQNNPMTVNQQMEEMGISNAVKRPVTRTLAIVKDVVDAMGHTPEKIFVEMARGADEKKQRKLSRKEQLLELYKKAEEDTSEFERQLEEMGDNANNQLQSDALFLYYAQLGKCMYSGEPIDISQLKSSKYNIDHIYPQSMVKDDSLLNNRVLVLSKINGDKTDVYPIASEIRTKMQPFWKKLLDCNLITKEKYSRLIRNTPFTDDEKMGFISRQLVETRQSMKAVTQLLNTLYPESEVVFVKARLASDLKNEFDFTPKTRITNDLHHAKDAYLNIVAGNVYHERFTKKWFNISDKYSLNTKTLFGRDVIHGDKVIWDADVDLPFVKKTYDKNSIHLTRYTYCQKGGFFDQMPIKKKEGLIELKKGMDTSKYGGYNKSAASFFVVVRYLKGGKREVSFVPIDLMVSERFLKDDAFAIEYLTNVLKGMNTKRIEEVELPLGKRVIKIKTVLSLDGYKVWISGKDSGGKRIVVNNAESAIYSSEDIRYIKCIESYAEKRKENRSFKHDSEHDGLSEDKNCSIYDVLTEKISNTLFLKMPGNQSGTLKLGKDKFVRLSFDDQISVLQNCINLLKTGRAGGCDLSLIGGKPKSGVPVLNASLSTFKSNYGEVRIIDMSPAGIHEKISDNLLELL